MKYASGDIWGSISDYNSCIKTDAKTADQKAYRSGVVAHCHDAKAWSYYKIDNTDMHVGIELKQSN